MSLRSPLAAAAGLILSLGACAHAPSAARSPAAPPTGKCYLPHDLSPLLKDNKFDLGYLDGVIADLREVAGVYPPRFAAEGDRERATLDVVRFSGMFEALVKAGPKEGDRFSLELSWRWGVLLSLGHNLDLPGAAERAQDRFREALALEPDHPEANYHYGCFLAGVGQVAQGIPYLEKARSLGVDGADYSLGLAYVVLDDRPRAIESMRRALERHPDDAKVRRLIEVLESGAPIERHSR